MVVLPLLTARVSTLMTSTVATQNIEGTQASLMEVEQELSTGKAINKPSDDPSKASLIEQLNKSIDDRTQWSGNIDQGASKLNQSEATLSDVSSLLTQVQSIASQNASNLVSADERTSAAAVVDSIYSQVLSSANTSFEGSYLFGADDAQAAPYQQSAGGVQFVGSATTLQNTFGENTDLNFQVSAVAAFGGVSNSISAGTNLSPAVTGATRLVDLGGANGDGVTPGAIRIGNGSATTTVDLTNADTLQGVVAAINAAAPTGVTASITSTGLTLVAGPGTNVTVTDVGNGKTARQLGISQPTGAGPGVSVVGANLDAEVTPLTPVSALRGGTGIDLSGIKVTIKGIAKSISFAGDTTVQDVLNSVNQAGVGLQASIRPDGSGIDLRNVTQGSTVSVGENGGASAAQLGFTTFKASASLTSLNDGKGVSTPAGNQFTITTADGTVKNIALSNAKTVQDVVDQINAVTGAGATASISDGGIVLTDHTTGASAFRVTAVNGATTAADLGLTASASGNVITGTDVQAVRTPGLFADLKKLGDSLRANDTAGITDAAAALQKDGQAVIDLRGVVGARVQEMNNRSDDLSTRNLANKSLLSGLQDVDYTRAVTRYQTLQTSLQASLQVTAKSMQLSLLDYLG